MKRALTGMAAAWLALFAPALHALEPGDAAPAFTAQSAGGATVTLSDLRGRWAVLYFFPKAFTSACAEQADGLRDGFDTIRRAGAALYGVSLDRPEVLNRFRKERGLPFDLLADPDRTMTAAYGVLGLGGLYARRVTFIIDPGGRIAAVLDRADAARHAREILETVESLRAR